MSEDQKPIRLIKAAKEFNVGISTIVDFLLKKGFAIESSPNTKILPEMYVLLVKEFQSEKTVKEESRKIGLDFSGRQTISIDDTDIKHFAEEKEKEQEDLFIKNLQLDKQPKYTETKERLDKASAPDETVKEKVKELTPEAKEEENQEAATSKEVDKEDDKKIKVVGKLQLDTITPKLKTSKKETVEKKAPKETAEEKEEVKDEKIKEKETPEKDTKEDKAAKEKVPEAKQIEEVEEKPETIEESEGEQAESFESLVPDNFIPTEFEKLIGPKILHKIDLPEFKKPEKKPVASSSDEKPKKKKRKRIKKEFLIFDKEFEEKKYEKTSAKLKDTKGRKEPQKPEVSGEEIEKQIKETLARLSPMGKSKASKHRRLKRELVSQHLQKEKEKQEAEKKIIKVTEFVSASELANMMNLNVNEIISTCMSLGLFVSINQRLDAETIVLVAEEFGYKVEFVSVDVQEAIWHSDEEDNKADHLERSPIVTVMGHVDHGKTSLLDYIRKTNVIAGEAGGITQHIGAYEVTLENGKKITFLDTPGHEAFTAMRARGAQVTDVAIIVVAADDTVMPQTIEAINHAQAAGVPIVFAINKIDKPNAEPEKIKEALSKINILVEDWGGKYQSQEISAKKGDGVASLLEKVLLEAELLDLKGNPKIMAVGTVIESSLDKGRGYITKVLIQNGTMRIGDIVLAGANYGKVKAMFNERNLPVREAGPSAPILMLGLNGAPQAGDSFKVMPSERDAKAIATKRLIYQREQGLRTQKHITLDEIGRRIAIGDFKELNIIVKADVAGSVEALSDSLLKLSNEEIQVNVIHQSVGAVTETDVLLASASNAIIVGFQVRPSLSARKLAEQEQIDIRLYSVIYKAIDEIKSAIEGMLSPDIEEKILCNIEVREVFKITKVGTVAGCMVLDGKINRNTKVRIIRDGIVIFSGILGSLKRFKDDVKEVQSGYECGLNIENYNDIKVGDIIEGYEEIEVKRKLV